jgi:amino acid adenylation domain-containing protein
VFDIDAHRSFGQFVEQYRAQITASQSATLAANDTRSSARSRILLRLAQPQETVPHSPDYDLVLTIGLNDAQIILRSFYQASLYREDMVAVMHESLGIILSQPPAAPLSCLTAPNSVQQRFIAGINETEQAFVQDEPLIALIEKQGAILADKPCFISEGKHIVTWQALNSAADRIAKALCKAGIKGGDVVGLMTNRSVAFAAGMLGILKAGAAYLPLDHNYPLERLEYLAGNAGISLALSNIRHTRLSIPTLALDEFLNPQPIHNRDGGTAKPFNSPLALNYLIYTSGSTGKPKGVLLDQIGRLNNFSDFNRRFNVGEKDSVLAVSSLSFDMSAYDILGSFMAGSRIVMVPDTALARPERWIDLMCDHHVTIWHSVPSLLGTLIDAIEAQSEPRRIPPGLRLILLGGDWIPVGMIGRIRRIWPQATIVSLGGATELSMDSTIYTVETADPSWKSIPYGHPMANQTAYVLDESGDLVAPGIAGQLFLGGRGVAWGYAGMPALTAEKFRPAPFSTHSGERIYATGDLARLMPDGELELLGRIDFQVKIKGLRIELGEIETVLRDLAAIENAVVMATPLPDGGKQLTAWLIVREDEHSQKLLARLRQELAKRLPGPMIPSRFLFLDQIPLSLNGKIDRRRLLEIAQA